MGFIRPSDGSAEVFVHRSALTGIGSLQSNQEVTFEAGWDPLKAKPVAKSVWAQSPLTSQPAEVGTTAADAAILAAGETQGQQTGVVKVWQNERGMGFIGPDNNGPDLFVHRSRLLDGETLIVGSRVCFEAGIDPMKGKGVALKVTGAVGASQVQAFERS